MKTNSKNKILCVLIAVFAVLCCAIMALNVFNAKNTLADEPSSTEFYVDGASIRQVTGSSGIRFGTILTKTGWEKIIAQYPADTYDYKLYTVIDKTGNTDANEAKEIVHDAFTFGENETKKLFWSTITYDDLSEEDKEKAYSVPLTATTKIDVLNKGTTTVVDTFEPDGNEISRTIREVAWKAIEDGEVGEMLTTYRGTTSTNNTKKEFDVWGDSFAIDGITETVKSVYVGEEKANAFTHNEGVLSVDWESVSNPSKAQQVNLVTDEGVVTYSNVKPVYLLRQKTASKLRTVPDGAQIRMIENINMNGVAFDADSRATVQNIVLDGQGLSISNLKSTDVPGDNRTDIGSGLFAGLNGGTIKDLSIVNYKGGSDNGFNIESIIATTANSGLNMEDVYIQADTFGTNSSAAIARQTNHTTLTFKNVYVSIPKNAGYILASTSNLDSTKGCDVVLDNCHFVGGSGRIDYSNTGKMRTKSSTSDTADYTVYKDKAYAYNALVSDETSVKTKFLAGEGSEIIPLTNKQEDVKKFCDATTGYFVLAENVNMATYITDSTASNYPLQANFKGVLHGAGHTLTVHYNRRVSTAPPLSGLWCRAGGTTICDIKIIINSWYGDFGGLVNRIDTTVFTMNNVYLTTNASSTKLNGITPSGNGSGAICSYNTNVNLLSLTNVVIDLPTTTSNIGFIGGTINNGGSLGTSCYFIGGSGKYSGVGAQCTSGGIYSDLDSFKTAYAKEGSKITLTDELKGWLGIIE